MNQPESNLLFLNYCKKLKEYYLPNRKILFIQLPQMPLKSFSRKIALNKGYFVFPPTGLQYLYEALKHRDLDIRILDLNFMLLKRVFEDESFNHNNWLDLVSEYLDFCPFIIGVSCIFDSNLNIFLSLLDYLKNMDRSIIITGGCIPTYGYEDLLSKKLCHFVVCREGENKINFLFDHITNDNFKNEATSQIYFSDNDKIYETEGYEDNVMLNKVLMESYSIIPITDYGKYGSLNPFTRMHDRSTNNNTFSTIQVNRGCRGNCSFCSVRDFMGKKVRTHNFDNVIKEMEFLIDSKNIKHFEWLDDDLLFNKKLFKCILKEIIKRNWDITWSANNGIIAGSIDDELLLLMQKSGCIGFKIGIETGNAEMLKKIKKPANLNVFRKLAKKLDDYQDIFVGGNFIIGFPQEKFSQMLDSFKLASELNLDWNAFTICQSIRGASAFSDFDDYFSSQFETAGNNVKNFIPSRDTSIKTDDSVYKGLDIFRLDPDYVPNESQIREIWQSFTIITNFINSKHLKPEGNTKKFIEWVEMAMVAYPSIPYMSLFLSLAYLISGNSLKSKKYLLITQKNCKSHYWQNCFSSFNLLNITENFPNCPTEALETIDILRNCTDSFIKMN